ncbi:MAG: alanine racemase [Patescibacteria group bacterium]|nr:alanine racemase [Patescibacteria group bacterium]MDD5490458.1 alanine racemase [Patescibacteria group bacterium]
MDAKIAKCKTWVEVDGLTLKNNIKELSRILTPATQMMAVVKANAYGHGLTEVSKICVQSGVQWLGVDSIEEGIILRKEGIKSFILILGYTVLECLSEIFENDLDLVVYNKETVEELGRLSEICDKTANLHIKLETGTNRQGVGLENLLDFVNLIKKYPKLNIRGIYTHFANIEDTTNHSYAEEQLKKFKQAINFLEDLNIIIPLKHTACSAAAILFPDTHFNLARFGVSLYGFWPSRETIVSAQENGRDIKLKPCLCWKTRIAQIKALKSGTPVGYGLTEKILRDGKVAVLPVGYSDGLDRGLSSVGNVLVRGERCKILGRICMNMCVVDITHVTGAEVEDEVVLLGSQGREVITAEEVAGKLNTIHYEILSRINPMIPRFYSDI